MIKPKSINKERKLYIETGRQKVAEVLFKYPEKEFNLSELAIEAGVAKSNIGFILDEFYKVGFIEIIKLSKIWRIRVNRTSWFYKKNKIVNNLRAIYDTNLIEFLNEFYKNPKAIVLFGSFRLGDDISSSDIDIAIEVDEDKIKNSVSLYLKNVVKSDNETAAKQIEELEKRLERKIQIHVFKRGDIEESLFNSIANGIVLYGFLEVKK